MSFLTANSTQIASMFIPIIVAAFTPVCMLAINAWTHKAVDKQNEKISGITFKVQYVKILFGLLLFMDIFAGIVAVLFPILYLCDIPDGPPWQAAVAVACCFGTISAISIIFTIAAKRWQICVSNEQIKYVPLFGKIRIYSWEDITDVKVYSDILASLYRCQVFVNYGKKKAFGFTTLMPGGKQLAIMLQNKGLISGNYYL